MTAVDPLAGEEFIISISSLQLFWDKVRRGACCSVRSPNDFSPNAIGAKVTQDFVRPLTKEFMLGSMPSVMRCSVGMCNCGLPGARDRGWACKALLLFGEASNS